MFAVVWFAIGAYAVLSALRYRAYVNSLPPSAGNLKIKRQHRLQLIFGIVLLLIVSWNTYVYLSALARSPAR